MVSEDWWIFTAVGRELVLLPPALMFTDKQVAQLARLESGLESTLMSVDSNLAKARWIIWPPKSR